MKNIVFVFITFLFSFFGYAGPCGFTLNISPIDLVFDPVGQDILQNISLNNPNTNNSNLCKNFFVTFSKGGSQTYSNRELVNNFNETIDYNLYGRSNQRDILKDFDDVTNKRDIIEGKKNKPNQEFYFNQFPIATELRGGEYLDNVIVSLYSGKFNTTNAFEESYNIPIKVSVERYLNISIADSPTGFDPTLTSRTVSFNPLVEGDSGSFYFIVKSNVGYDIEVTSENGGNLAHVSGSDTISYKFYDDGVEKSFPVELGSGTGLSLPGGDVHPFSFEIQSVDNKLSGYYKDVIHITVTTNE